MNPSAPQSLAHAPVVSDCWNRIGVRGDLSCQELKQHAHCRNCPIYSAAGVALLDRELTPEYREERSIHFARAEEVEALETRSAFIFRIGVEWFALPASILDEVSDLRVIHSLPHRRNGIVVGLVDVRGELLICVSLGRMLGLEGSPAATPVEASKARPRLVVIRHDGGRTAFTADEVRGFQRYHPSKLKAVPITIAKGSSRYTNAILPWEDKAVGHLDEALVIHALNRSIL